jgi:hypothetical protein
MRIALVACVLLLASAPPARAAAAETELRVALGADLYFFSPDTLPAGALSLVHGDARATDFEARLSTIGIGSLLDAGARLYLGQGTFRPYLSARTGALLVAVMPVALAVAGGVGFEVGGPLSLDVEAGGYTAVLGDLDDLSRAARLSVALRF